jgi:hypothetical protein
VTQTAPFTPDDLYCVYCHAVAAGVCAACGALCCGDCVDLVMGLTTRRAICHDCVRKGHRSGDVALRRWLLIAAVGLVGVGAILLLTL